MGDFSLLRKEINLGGLECSQCAKAICKTVSQLEGIENCNLDLDKKVLKIIKVTKDKSAMDIFEEIEGILKK